MYNIEEKGSQSLGVGDWRVCSVRGQRWGITAAAAAAVEEDEVVVVVVVVLVLVLVMVMVYCSSRIGFPSAR